MQHVTIPLAERASKVDNHLCYTTKAIITIKVCVRVNCLPSGLNANHIEVHMNSHNSEVY